MTFPLLAVFSALLLFLAPRPGRSQAVEVRTIAASIEAGTGGLEAGPQGEIYTSDFGASLGRGPAGTRVLRIAPNGQVAEYATGLRGASGNLLLRDGRLLQSNVAGHSVSIIATDGTVSTVVSEGLRSPVGIAEGPDGFYVANCGSNTVRRIRLDGASHGFSADSLLRCPNGIVRASDGNFYVSNFYNGDVVRLLPDGRAERLATLPGANNGHLVFGNGVLYVAARTANQIWEVTLDGATRLLVGTGARGHQDGAAGTATFSLPNDLALSPDGRTLYVNEVEPSMTPDEILTPTRVRAITLGAGGR